VHVYSSFGSCEVRLQTVHCFILRLLKTANNGSGINITSTAVLPLRRSLSWVIPPHCITVMFTVHTVMPQFLPLTR